MKNAGLNEEIIAAKISSEPSKFDTSTEAISVLKKNKFSDSIISLIIEKNAQNNQNADFVTSIREVDGNLLINESITLSVGSKVQILLPAERGQDFLFVEKEKKFLNAKTIGVIADAVGTGATAVAIGSNDLGTLVNATDVMRKSTAVSWGVEAINKIEDLPISKQAKKIAGKKMEVLSWEFTEDGCTLKVKHNKGKYLIDLQNAINLGEVKL